MAKKRGKKNIPARISPFVLGYLVTLKKIGVPIERAYLFGSWAKGEQHEYSDIDLAIVSPAFADWEKKSKLLSKAMYMDFSSIEPHGFHPRDFKSEENPVAYEVRKNGIRII